MKFKKARKKAQKKNTYFRSDFAKVESNCSGKSIVQIRKGE